MTKQDIISKLEHLVKETEDPTSITDDIEQLENAYQQLVEGAGAPEEAEKQNPSSETPQAKEKAGEGQPAAEATTADRTQEAPAEQQPEQTTDSASTERAVEQEGKTEKPYTEKTAPEATPEAPKEAQAKEDNPGLKAEAKDDAEKQEPAEATTSEKNDTALDGRYKELINLYYDKLRKYEEQQKEDEEANYTTKQGLLEELKALIKDAENIGESFSRFYDILDRWKKTGNVPARYYKKLQSEWSHQIDMFFYTMNIYKALKEEDLTRNLERKTELARLMKELLNEKSIKKVEMLVKSYQNEWAETGPVPQEYWKELRNTFWQTTNDVYKRIKDHYDSIREEQQRRQEAKEAIIERAKAMTEQLPENPKKWKQRTDKVLELQQEWKKIGYGPRDTGEALWKAFRAECDKFFAQKKEFYDQLKGEQKKVKAAKEKIIEKAEAQQDSTEWKDTTKKLIDLQKQWKAAGSAGPKDEKQLWPRFRAACDKFFEAKKEFFATLDDRQADNLKQKKALIEEIEKYELTGNANNDIAALKDFSKRWFEIGHVPKKNIDEVGKQYKKALDEKYKGLKMDKAEKAEIRFKQKVENISKTNNADKQLHHERQQIQKKIKSLKGTLEQYETNLGFFRNAKNAAPLLTEVEKNIQKTKDELEKQERLLKLLPKKQQHQKQR